MNMASSLRIGYLSTLYHTSHLLRELCWIEQDLEIDCRWRLYGTGPEMVKAFEEQDIDIGYIGLPPALIGLARGVSLVCVGGGHVEGTVIVGGPAFRDLAESDGMGSFLGQLRGRRVGIPSAGSIHDVIFRALLMEHSVSEAEVVNYPWADLLPYQLRKGEIEAAVGTPPLAVLCERECGTRILIPPEVLWPFNPSYGIVIRREMLKEEALIEGFLGLHERACNLIRDLPEQAARSTVSALPGLDEPFVRQAYNVSPKYCASLPEAYVESALAFLPVMRQLGYVGDARAAEEIFEPRFIKKVHPDPHHYSRRETTRPL
jgi:NitT/TauT family transport system substrate-binding protein